MTISHPSILAKLVDTPDLWPSMRRVEAALDRTAATFRSDAAKLAADPLPGYPHANEVYDEVARVLASLAREIRQSGGLA